MLRHRIDAGFFCQRIGSSRVLGLRVCCFGATPWDARDYDHWSAHRQAHGHPRSWLKAPTIPATRSSRGQNSVSMSLSLVQTCWAFFVRCKRLSMKGFLCRRLGHGRSRSAGCRGDSGSVGTGVECPRAAGVVHGRCNRSDDSEGFCASASLGHHQLSPTCGKVWRASGPPSGWVCQSARVGCDHRSLDGSGIDDRHTPWLAEGRVCNATDGEAPRAAGLLIGLFSVLPCSSRSRHDLAGTSELAF